MNRFSNCNQLLLTVVIAFTCVVTALSQGPQKNANETIWQPKQLLPPIVIAKHDVKDASNLSVLIPETIYEQLTITFASKKTEGEFGTINDLREYFGPLERKSIPLSDLRFETIGGEPIPVEQAIKRLANPQHVFYGRGPDKSHAQVVRAETIVLKSSTEQPLPRSKSTYPE